MITEFLRAQAGWRLANTGSAPVPTARCAAALLDAATYAATLRDDDPDLAALERGGCFRGNVFDPGPRGISLARWWQFGETAHARPRDLIAALAVASGSARGSCRTGGHRKPEPAAPQPAAPARAVAPGGPHRPAGAGAPAGPQPSAGPQVPAQAPAPAQAAPAGGDRAQA